MSQIHPPRRPCPSYSYRRSICLLVEYRVWCLHQIISPTWLWVRERVMVYVIGIKVYSARLVSVFFSTVRWCCLDEGNCACVCNIYKKSEKQICYLIFVRHIIDRSLSIYVSILRGPGDAMIMIFFGHGVRRKLIALSQRGTRGVDLLWCVCLCSTSGVGRVGPRWG